MQPASGHGSLCGSNDSTCGSLASCKPASGIVASHEACTGLEGVATAGLVAGPSKVCGKERALAGPSCPPPDITCPDIPDSCSDTETIYSVQGYETGVSSLYETWMVIVKCNHGCISFC